MRNVCKLLSQWWFAFVVLIVDVTANCSEMLTGLFEDFVNGLKTLGEEDIPTENSLVAITLGYSANFPRSVRR